MLTLARSVCSVDGGKEARRRVSVNHSGRAPHTRFFSRVPPTIVMAWFYSNVISPPHLKRVAGTVDGDRESSCLGGGRLVRQPSPLKIIEARHGGRLRGLAVVQLATIPVIEAVELTRSAGHAPLITLTAAQVHFERFLQAAAEEDEAWAKEKGQD